MTPVSPPTYTYVLPPFGGVLNGDRESVATVVTARWWNSVLPIRTARTDMSQKTIPLDNFGAIRRVMRLIRRTVALTFALPLAFTVPCMQAHAGQECESLRSLRLSDTTIVSTDRIAAGASVPPPVTWAPPRSSAPFKNLPAFCRVVATAHPTAKSDIKIEVWLPSAQQWNGKFHGVGNGGLAGVIPYEAMVNGVSRGY